MALRWTYRWELHHLLKLCGFMIEAEHGDFAGSASVYGKELIVVARVLKRAFACTGQLAEQAR